MFMRKVVHQTIEGGLTLQHCQATLAVRAAVPNRLLVSLARGPAGAPAVLACAPGVTH